MTKELSLEATMDENVMMEFVHKAVGDVAAVLAGSMVVIGDRLGLYRAMAGAGAVSSEELATTTGTSERYVREWLGAQEFVALERDDLEGVGPVDLVFDLIGGDIGKRSARLVRPGGTLVSIVGPSEARPADGLAIDFVVEADRAQLTGIVQRLRDGRLRAHIGTVATLDDAVAAFNPTERRPGKTIVSVRP
jgi:NADPH:quinone reductase-like Zn-dependent oxidoreductase